MIARGPDPLKSFDSMVNGMSLKHSRAVYHDVSGSKPLLPSDIRTKHDAERYRAGGVITDANEENQLYIRKSASGRFHFALRKGSARRIRRVDYSTREPKDRSEAHDAEVIRLEAEWAQLRMRTPARFFLSLQGMQARSNSGVKGTKHLSYSGNVRVDLCLELSPGGDIAVSNGNVCKTGRQGFHRRPVVTHMITIPNVGQTIDVQPGVFDRSIDQTVNLINVHEDESGWWIVSTDNRRRDFVNGRPLRLIRSARKSRSARRRKRSPWAAVSSS